VGSNRRASGLAAHRERANLDLGVVADPLELIGHISSADESAISLDGDVYWGADQGTVATVGGEQDVLLMNERFESRRYPG
jgi:hypothetical protein